MKKYFFALPAAIVMCLPFAAPTFASESPFIRNPTVSLGPIRDRIIHSPDAPSPAPVAPVRNTESEPKEEPEELINSTSFNIMEQAAQIMQRQAKQQPQAVYQLLH
ncbi:hypothetical protein FACS1894188_03960 [Clostridia bacterium]|nr:hypothetical protein FACS1894188_03960 [Clostridia bacterium]